MDGHGPRDMGATVVPSCAHTLQRKRALARAAPCDNAGSYTASVNADAVTVTVAPAFARALQMAQP